MSYSVQVKWPGDGSFTDVTAEADRDYSFDLYSGGKDFKFVKNTFEISLVYSSSLALKLLSLTPADLVPVTIDKDAARLFTGYLIPIDGQTYASWKRTTIPVTVQDPSLALDTALTADLILIDHWLSKPADTTKSLIHKLMALASATVSYSSPNTAGTMGGTFDPVSNNYLRLFVARAGDNLLETLSALLWQQGWRWWFDASGVAQFAAWTATTASTVTFSAANENVVDGSFRIDKTNMVEDSVELSYSLAKYVNEVAKDGKGWKCYKANDPDQKLKLKTSGTKRSERKTLSCSLSTTRHITILAPTSAEGREIFDWVIPTIRLYFAVNYHTDTTAYGNMGTSYSEVRDDDMCEKTLDFDTATGVITVSKDYDPDYPSTHNVTISGYTNVKGKLDFDLAIGADPIAASGGASHTNNITIGILVPDMTATFRGDDAKEYSYGTRRSIKKFSAALPTADELPGKLALWLREQVLELPQTYAVKSYGNYSLGAGATVDVGGVSASGIIYGKSYDEGSRQYTYRVKQLTNATTGSSVITAGTVDAGSAITDAGSDPEGYEYWIDPSTRAATRTTAGVVTPGTIYGTAMRRIGGGAGVPILAKFRVWEYVSGSWTKTYESSTAEATVVYTPSASNMTQIRLEMYGQGGFTTLLWTTIVPVSADLASVTADATTKANAAQSAAQTYANGLASSLQSQIDGAITTWFYSGAPTLANAPANGWTTNPVKDAHLGDLYYDTATGYAYRFANSSGYTWLRISDTDVVTALANAATAQATANSKNTVFASLALAQATGVAGDLFLDSSLLYRATVAGGSITLANSVRLTAKRFADVADSTARAAITGMIANDTVYQTDALQWYVYLSGAWTLDGATQLQGIAPPQDSLALALTAEDIPAYPDGVEVYKQDTWSNNAGWAGNTGNTLSVVNGKLVCTSNGVNTLSLGNTYGSFGSKCMVIKVSCSTPITAIHTYNGSAFVTIAYTLVDQYTAIVSDFVVASISYIYINMPSVVVAVATIYYWYVGDGTYASKVIDSSKSNLRLTNTGVVPVPGPSGTAMRFNGASYLQSPDAFTATSVSFIAKLSSIGDSNPIIMSALNGAAFIGFGEQSGPFINESLSVARGADGSFYIQGGNPRFLDDIEHHFVIISSATQAKIYVDGISETVIEYNLTKGPIESAGSPLIIGRYGLDASYNITGTISNPLIWSGYALTDANVKYLYANKNNLSNLSGKSASLQIPALDPRYLGSGPSRPSNPHEGDWCLAEGTLAGATSANYIDLLKWDGSAWVADADQGHYNAAGADIIAWCASNVARLPPTGWQFVANLVASKIFADAIQARTLTVTGTINANNGYFKGELKAASGQLGGIKVLILGVGAMSFGASTQSGLIASVFAAFGGVGTYAVGVGAGTYAGKTIRAIESSAVYLKMHFTDNTSTSYGLGGGATTAFTASTFYATVEVSSDVFPIVDDVSFLGAPSKRWYSIFASREVHGGYFTGGANTHEFYDGIAVSGAGYIKFSDGSAEAWGVTDTTDGTSTVAFPITFSAAPIVVATIIFDDTTNRVAMVRTVSTTGCTIRKSGLGNSTSTAPANWHAKGRWY